MNPYLKFSNSFGVRSLMMNSLDIRSCCCFESAGVEGVRIHYCEHRLPAC